MLTNTDMTLYNRLYDPDSGVDIYRRTVIRGVNWHSKARVTPEGRGLVNADLYQIRIPLGADTGGKTYQPPGAYTGDETTWTLGQGDNTNIQLKHLLKNPHKTAYIKAFAPIF